MDREIKEILLPDGTTVLARVSVLEPDEIPPSADEDEFAYDDVGALDTLTSRIDALNDVITGVGSAVLDAARAASPDEVTATFGVELVAKPGKAVAMLADGEAKASVSVTLTWRPGRDGRRNDDGRDDGDRR
ncbi:hypothetical protein KDA82_01960, partial [Streptomyces daliensis]|nr:hypothetical protein [Streptomyces daliensis]